MRNVFRLASGSIGLAAALAAAAPQAQAGQPLILENDQSQMIVLPAIPGSVVIGNPTIADATVEGTKMFIHGRGFGTTNMLIMDMDGNQMADFEVSIRHMVPNTVALFKGPDRISYNCAPICEAETQVGDEITYFKMVADETKKKFELATGTDSAKSEAPPAPQ
jgi:hypothetical protein